MSNRTEDDRHGDARESGRGAWPTWTAKSGCSMVGVETCPARVSRQGVFMCDYLGSCDICPPRPAVPQVRESGTSAVAQTTMHPPVRTHAKAEGLAITPGRGCDASWQLPPPLTHMDITSLTKRISNAIIHFATKKRTMQIRYSNAYPVLPCTY